AAASATELAETMPLGSSTAGVDVFTMSSDDKGDDVFTSATEGAWFDAAKDAESPPVFETCGAGKVGAGHESGVISLPGTVSEAADQAGPEPVASKPESPTAPQPAEAAAPPKASVGSKVQRLLIGAVLLLNIALVAGMITLRVEGQKARAPVAALSVDVKELHEQQAASQAQVAENRAQLKETRQRLDKQARDLAKTAEKVETAMQRQKDAEHDAKERATREARELASLSSRLRRVERNLGERSYSVDEAVKILDIVQGPKRPTSSASNGAHPEERKHAPSAAAPHETRKHASPTSAADEKHALEAKPVLSTKRH
ncbi:MAG TPA: hypothetical protein VM925_01425, partial [Labilithrix sp.]|nr:hypothetical protein [Labilithrix sp.]